MAQKIFHRSWIVFAALILMGFAQAQELDEGIQLYKEKKFEEAEKILRQVSQKEPENPGAHYHLGLTLLELERLEEAESEMDQAAQLGLPTDEAKVGLARVVMKKGNRARALTLLNEAAEEKADNPDVYHYRGIVQASRQDFVSSAADLEKAIQLDPSNAYNYYYAGMAYSRLRRPDKMVNNFQMFLKLAPNAPEARKIQSLLRSVR